MIFTVLFCLLLSACCCAQNGRGPATILDTRLAGNYKNASDKKSTRIIEQLNKQTDKYLDRLEKQEARIKKKLSRIDSIAAHNILADARSEYQIIQNKLKNKSGELVNKAGQ